MVGTENDGAEPGRGTTGSRRVEMDSAIMQDPKVEALKAEIKRLQDAKRRALKVADERSRENVELRATLKAFTEVPHKHPI
jgi:hypothetical protein